MHFPQWIDLKGMDTIAETVHHVVCYVDPEADKQWIRERPTKYRLEVLKTFRLYDCRMIMFMIKTI